MKLCDARSYFSGSLELTLVEPSELRRQLEAHADEAAYIRDALLELAAFARFHRELARDGKTLAGSYAAELVWDAGAAGIRDDELRAEVMLRYRMAGSRAARVVRRMIAGPLFELERFRRPGEVFTTTKGPHVVRLATSRHARLAIAAREAGWDSAAIVHAAAAKCAVDESAGLREAS